MTTSTSFYNTEHLGRLCWADNWLRDLLSNEWSKDLRSTPFSALRAPLYPKLLHACSIYIKIEKRSPFTTRFHLSSGDANKRLLLGLRDWFLWFMGLAKSFRALNKTRFAEFLKDDIWELCIDSGKSGLLLCVYVVHYKNCCLKTNAE